MARPTIPRAKKVMIAPEPPKKENLERVIPDPTKRAAKHIGYDKLMGTSKGHNKSAHEKAYNSLYKLLDHRQRVLIMQMKSKNEKIKKRENPEPAYVDLLPKGDYLVQRILNFRRRKGLLQYQMLWEGFPLEMASWEPIRLIDGDIATLVKNFYKEFPGKPGDPVKSTAFIAEDDEDDIPAPAVGGRGPKFEKAKKAHLFDANRPVGVGGAAARACSSSLLPQGARRSLDDKALSQGKVKSSPKSLPDYSIRNDDDGEEFSVLRPAYPAGLVSMASPIANPGVTAGRSVQTAVDLFSNDSDAEQEVKVSQNPFRNNRGTKGAHGGKEMSANKKPRDDSDSSDYDLTTSPVAANSMVQIRKKAKMSSTQERKAQKSAAGMKEIDSHMDDLFGEAPEVRSSRIPKPDIPNVPDRVIPVDKEYLVVVARNQSRLM